MSFSNFAHWAPAVLAASFLLLLSAAQTNAQVVAADAGPGAASELGGDRFEPVRREVREEIAEGNLTSLTVAVSRRGKILWRESFGWADAERRIPATPETMYSLASISKPFTATAIMILAERGLVSLDRPANGYLGAAKLQAHAWDPDGATVRLVAAHMAGLPLHHHFFPEKGALVRPSPEETIRRYGALVTPPGERYQYSNLGYAVLERIVERVSGQPYSRFMRESVFEPLGLERSGVPEADGGPRFAKRYRAPGEPLPFYDFDHRGASAVYSSADDLIRFARFHLGEIESPLLNWRTLRRMQRPVAKGYGFGWSVARDAAGRRIVSHGGGMPGVTTLLTLVPEERLAIVVLSNCGHGAPARVHDAVLQNLLPRSQRRTAGGPRIRKGPGKRLSGEWQGSVRTAGGVVPLQLTLSREGPSTARLGDSPTLELAGVRREGRYLIADLAEPLPLPDALAQKHFVRLTLRARSRGTLNGSAAALSARAAGMPRALSYWVALDRRTRPEKRP